MNKSIAVVHGGISHEREKSLHYGKHMAKILGDLGFDVTEMHLHPNGAWTVNGQVQNVEEALKKTGKVWNCLVGVDGERGIVEKLCEKCKTKLVGHTLLHSHLAGDKKNLQLILEQHKIKSPFGKVLRKIDYTTDKLKEVFATVPMPAVVKPLVGSGIWGLQVVTNFKEYEQAVNFLIGQGEDVLVEKLIDGIPVSCFVFEKDNLLHTNIKIHEEGAVLSRDVLMMIRNEALYIHSALAFKHHVEYDFIVTSKGLYFLEINTHPSLVSGYIKDAFASGVVNLKEYVKSKVLI